MKETVITRQTEGTKLLRLLTKLLPGADKNFLYKMLRKKNITLNDKKAVGSELLQCGDSIKIYFSDETYERFAGNDAGDDTFVLKKEEPGKALDPLLIIYEDEDILLVNKPAGVLSQKAAASDVSMVELISEYLYEKGEYEPGAAGSFKPAVANRLDRNTTGVLAAGKSIKGLKYLSAGFKERSFRKLYMCAVAGCPEGERLLNGLWSKDSHGNKVTIRDVGAGPDGGFPTEYFVKGNVPVQTRICPVKSNGEFSLVSAELLTGKTHQIRAQLAGAGFPLVGDHKYGKRDVNQRFKELYCIEFQQLHAFLLHLPDKGTFYANVPEQFRRVLEGEGLWLHGIREVFGDQLLRTL